MESRDLAALLSSLVSQLFLLLHLIFPSSSTVPVSIFSNFHPSDSLENLFLLIHHFLSSTELASSLSLSLSLSHKRKRTHLLQSDSDATLEENETQLAGSDNGRAQVNSALPRSPDSFKLCFRMTSSTFEWLSGLLEPLLDCRDPAGVPLNLPAEVRLGVGLFRLATGSGYTELARRFRVSEPVARFCAKQLCRVLCTNFRFWVAFPSPSELDSVSAEFETLAGLPNCCGAVACARFEIGKNGESLWQNDAFLEETVAAQIVVDSSSRILSIVAGYRGEKSDSQVLRSSTLYKDVQGGSLLKVAPTLVNNVAVNQYLIGNGEYPLLPWLMAPFLDPPCGSSEESFNLALSRIGGSTLRAVASLKNWGVLSRPIEEEFRTAVAYIGACSILHNILLMRDDPSALAGAVGDEYLPRKKVRCGIGSDSLKGNFGESKASVIRSALATRAGKFFNSTYRKVPTVLEHLDPS